MDKNNKQFTSGYIDNQIDKLLDRAPNSSNKELVKNLQQMYQDNEHSLEKVWQRLGLEGDTPTHIQQPSTASYLQEKPSAKVFNLEKHRQTRRSGSGIAHTFSLLAAILVATLIIGSMLTLTYKSARYTSISAGSPVFPNIMRSQSLPSTAEIYLSNSEDLFKLDTQTRKALWQQPLKDIIKAIPDGKNVYLLQSDISNPGVSAVLALDGNSGKTLWKHPFTMQTTDLAFSQDLLYVSGNNTDTSEAKKAGQVYALNPLDGSRHMTYPATDSVWSLVVDDGILGISTNSGLYVYASASGKLLWEKNSSVESMRLVDGLLYVAFVGTTSDINYYYITAYEAPTGHIVWQSPATADQINGFTVEQSTIYFGTLIYSIHDKPFQGVVYAYDMQQNQQLWSQKVDGGVQQPILINNDMVYIAADNGSQAQAHITALKATTGAIAWVQSLDNSLTNSLSMSNGVLFIGNYSGLSYAPIANSIYALQSEDGKKLEMDTKLNSTQEVIVSGQ